VAFLIRLLGAGPTANGGTISAYSVSSPALAAIVSNVRLVNTTGGTVFANVTYNVSGGGAARISDNNKSIAAGDILTIKPELTMSVGDVIYVSTSAAIDYVVCGVEKV
jgi:hypothetical protein